MSQFGRLGVLAEQLVVPCRTGAAVEVLVRNRDKALVEKRIALARDLHPFAKVRLGLVDLLALITQNGDLTAAGRRVNADDLLIAAEFGDWNGNGHEMNVESALGILAGSSEFEQIKHRLDIRVETI